MTARRASLRWKILFYSSSLLIALIAGMLAYVDYQAERFVHQRIDSDIDRGRDTVARAEQQRLEGLSLSASLIASIPQLKSLVVDTDSATIVAFLQNYETNNHRSDLLIVLDPSGRVLARTDRNDPAPLPNLSSLIASASGEPFTGITEIDSAAYHIAAAPAEAAGTVYCMVVAAARIDAGFARNLHQLSNDDIVLIGSRILGTNLDDSVLTLHTPEQWHTALGDGAGLRTLRVNGENYEALTSTLGTAAGEHPIAVIMQSHDRAMAPYRQIQYGLLLLGLLVATAGIVASAFLARSVTAPVAKLVKGTEQVALGNLDYRIDVPGKDEIGDLAQSFNAMIQGLRERADMEKFVSHSTVDMIQSAQKRVSAGENVRITIFFSDMRGFTAMTEHRRPEETVKILNTCLSLQAAQVKRFGGDIDKFVGDCVVALFKGEDMELNAIRCAVEIHRALDSHSASNPEDPPLRVGIGIVTGEVILGSIGSNDRLDYTAIGSNVNLCSRLCSNAAPHETLLSETVYERVRDLVAAEKREALQVKGFSQPVAVYRMTTAPRSATST